MRVDRHLLRRDWLDVRADIERILQAEQFKPIEFRPLGVYDNWQAIQARIYQTFCKLDSPASRPSRLWNACKEESFSVAVDYNRGYTFLVQLVDYQETVWFFVQGNQDKLWFYEGQISAIVKIIGESYHIDELYVASKEYEWLLGLDYHDVLHAAGGAMPERLRQLKEATDY